MIKPVSLRLGLSLIVFAVYSSAQSSALTDRAAARFLEQATFGPTATDISNLESQGFNAWLGAQYAMAPSYLPDQAIMTVATATAPATTNTNLTPVQQAFFVNSITGADQLRQRVAFALSEQWVVSTEAVTAAYAYPPYWKAITDNAFGNYRDIIMAVTLNPAMGNYLSMANNNKANGTQGTSANENYSRELMQLFTIGLTELNLDGSPVMHSSDPVKYDATGNPVADPKCAGSKPDASCAPLSTYTQAMVTSQAKALTGWTYPTAPGATAKNNNPGYYIGQMIPVAAEHDTTSKTILGNVVIPAGQSAQQDLDTVVDTLMKHRTMAPFVCTQLIQHLVTSNPSPQYIQRVSAVFENNGVGITGDMQSVIRAILFDPEARAGDDPTSSSEVNFGHLREPVVLISHLVRALGGVPTASNSLNSVANNMGQSLFNQGSVFSYFSPDNMITVDSPVQSNLTLHLLGPEFQIYTTQTATQMGDNAYNATYGASIGGTKLAMSEFNQYKGQIGPLLDEIDLVFTHSSMSASLRQQAQNAAANASSAQNAVYAALYIVLTSGEYLVIH